MLSLVTPTGGAGDSLEHFGSLSVDTTVQDADMKLYRRVVDIETKVEC